MSNLKVGWDHNLDKVLVGVEFCYQLGKATTLNNHLARKNTGKKEKEEDYHRGH